jgi:hypothetical protein
VPTADNLLVCTLSGFVVGKQEGESTPGSDWTGRNHADPDMRHAGPTWRRRSSFNDSRRAFALSESLNTTVDACYVHDAPRKKQRGTAAQPARRGARCVNEPVAEKSSCAVERAPRHAESTKVAGLLQDAKVIFSKIIRQRHTASVVQTHAPHRADHARSSLPSHAAGGHQCGAASSSQAPADARLLNPAYVTQLALSRYAARVCAGTDRFDLCRLHDVVLAANAFNVETRQRRTRQRSVAAFNAMQAQLAHVVVAIWQAITLTPHVSRARTSADSFRSFVCGVLYGTKRGLSWNGHTIVPCLPGLCNLLPSIRNSSATDTARALQSSSHRGLCLIHNALNSIDRMPAQARAAVEARLASTHAVAARLQETVATGTAMETSP